MIEFNKFQQGILREMAKVCFDADRHRTWAVVMLMRIARLWFPQSPGLFILREAINSFIVEAYDAPRT